MRYKLVCSILSLGLGLSLTACGATKIDLKESLTIAMFGAFEAPADATGNAEPRSQTYTLQDVALVAADGTVVDLYDEDAKEVRIINRAQIIHAADLSDYKENSYASIRVQFAAGVVGAGNLEDELTLTLADPVIVYAQTFTVEKAIAQRLEIQVNWKNTITRDDDADPVTEVMAAPAFATQLVDGD